MTRAGGVWGGVSGRWGSVAFEEGENSLVADLGFVALLILAPEVKGVGVWFSVGQTMCLTIQTELALGRYRQPSPGSTL